MNIGSSVISQMMHLCHVLWSHQCKQLKVLCTCQQLLGAPSEQVKWLSEWFGEIGRESAKPGTGWAELRTIQRKILVAAAYAKKLPTFLGPYPSPLAIWTCTS